jgi:hypothetical protein
VGVPLVHADGEMEGHDEAHSRFSHANSQKRARDTEFSRCCVAIYAVQTVGVAKLTSLLTIDNKVRESGRRNQESPNESDG